MLVNKSQIIDFIPQKSPMVMVDGLLAHDDKSSTSELHVEKSNIFCKDGIFQEAGLIENIAQTAALHEGYLAKMEGKHVKKGFIGAVKRLKIYSLPEAGKTITTTIRILNELMSAAIVAGEIYEGKKLVAACEMTIFTED